MCTELLNVTEGEFRTGWQIILVPEPDFLRFANKCVPNWIVGVPRQVLPGSHDDSVMGGVDGQRVVGTRVVEK